jgi:hypothetical protein
MDLPLSSLLSNKTQIARSMDVPLLLSDLHEDVDEENIQPSRPHIQGSTINGEQITKHDNNENEEDAVDELEADEVDLRVATS